MTTSLARPEGRAAPAVGATTSARVGLVLAGVGGIVAAAAYLASVVVGGIIVPGTRTWRTR
ncbi:MAG: hypothetical protein J0G30_12570 [Actinomycetales bacterium]|nr:hypothetical protein [Actinomycetales bacterium]